MMMDTHALIYAERRGRPEPKTASNDLAVLNEDLQLRQDHQPDYPVLEKELNADLPAAGVGRYAYIHTYTSPH